VGAPRMSAAGLETLLAALLDNNITRRTVSPYHKLDSM
jgi:hypothetical protein